MVNNNYLKSFHIILQVQAYIYISVVHLSCRKSRKIDIISNCQKKSMLKYAFIKIKNAIYSDPIKVSPVLSFFTKISS